MKYIFPTIMVELTEETQYARTFIVQAKVDGLWTSLLVSSPSEEEAMVDLRQLKGLSEINSIKPLTEALQMLEEAARNSEIRM